ncbi:MAG: ATP synthase F1 subunit delta [Phycisphaeraceae bacterium]
MPARQIRDIDRTWAEALFELASEHDQLEAIADEVDQLAELLRSEKQLETLLTSPALSRQERQETIDRLFQGRISDLLYRFLQVLGAKGRLSLLPGVLEAFAERMREHQGLVEVDVFVAHRLSDEQLASIQQSISDAIDKTAVLHQYVDESLLGGLKLRIGDRLLDASVATQLRRLQRRLHEVGQERARRGSGEVA